ncbi:MAG: recombinase family protein [Lachnospiraceae bacterium]|nr:recombinase family protein [Lachnospiraceae bacterium]
MQRVAIYNRCSTEEEAQKNALEVQAAESLELVEEKKEEGWQIVAQYVELESGTSTRKRKEYLKMVEDIKQNKFDIVVVKSIDRLARNAKDWYLFLDCLMKHNTRLYLYLERKFYQSEDALVTGIKAILAEEFSKELSAKIKNAHRRRQQKQNGLNITREMFGWNRIAKDKFEIDQEDATYFLLACQLVEAGCGFRRISNALYEAGARSRSGKRISEVQWRNMLRSPRAYGTVILHKREYDFVRKEKKEIPEEEWIVIEDALPALISYEYYQKIQEILDSRRKR